MRLPILVPETSVPMMNFVTVVCLASRKSHSRLMEAIPSSVDTINRTINCTECSLQLGDLLRLCCVERRARKFEHPAAMCGKSLVQNGHTLE